VEIADKKRGALQCRRERVYLGCDTSSKRLRCSTPEDHLATAVGRDLDQTEGVFLPLPIISTIRKVFGNPVEEPADALARLLASAGEDPVFRGQLTTLLQLPAAERESVINTALHEMRLRGESDSACAAFATLASEEGAAIALRVLGQS
jgi:hypothetical protein